MALIRLLTKVTEDGKIKVPKNVARETGLTPGATAEIKVTGTGSAQFITVHARKKGQLR